MFEKKTLSTGEIAKFCDVHFRTVSRWIHLGHLKSFKLPGRGNYRVTVEDFLDFLSSHKIPIPNEFQKQSNKILIVDDDLNMAKSIQRVLKQLHYETNIASDGFQAGLLLATNTPSLITLDLQMPGANGFDVLDLIQRTPSLSSTKILVISGLPQDQLELALKKGAHDYLEKPFRKETLIQKIESLLKIHTQTEEFLNRSSL